ncbi:BnaCnng78430D [Brassica napus]|uniref:BnaC04g24180D protein n=1 Tax=Brassica napus TaxID=3708 RepID=A0A078GZT9_BRANA|nr:BnaC04g24180D [Brassica napus]CDY72584.1 BnaCnng78430D [Brassica napus]
MFIKGDVYRHGVLVLKDVIVFISTLHGG